MEAAEGLIGRGVERLSVGRGRARRGCVARGPRAA